VPSLRSGEVNREAGKDDKVRLAICLAHQVGAPHPVRPHSRTFANRQVAASFLHLRCNPRLIENVPNVTGLALLMSRATVSGSNPGGVPSDVGLRRSADNPLAVKCGRW
jgi:hypothetical protein